MLPWKRGFKMLYATLKWLSRVLPRTTSWLIAISLLTASLAGCRTAGTVTAPQVAIDYACQLYGDPIMASGSKDTRQTAKRANQKDETFHQAGCY